MEMEGIIWYHAIVASTKRVLKYKLIPQLKSLCPDLGPEKRQNGIHDLLYDYDYYDS
jgi:hypothetical protein